MIYKNFERILVPEDNGKQNQTSVIQTNFKEILIGVTVIN